ncbi:MAG: OB-fold nucleic acid binding domain-containing protein [Candidatus Diapherotrites archaeon]|uniref:OB-fold nucleic acid binding domain-containing protein n=1 Tax=Candidatus Iainarchaeum sp. TaxID=3101447 RepID=A0A8T4L5E1_9ARCH|nr:OB-fold nucleic acid binding domain-containing protein [Candidatus Diapherotrites archaeon]
MELSDQLIGFAAAGCAVIGLGLLFYGLQAAEPLPLRIAEIDETLAGKKVALQGTVEWTRQAKTALLAGLKDGEEITVVAFKPGEGELRLLRKGGTVKVIGRIQEYRGELEVVIERVEALD